jgi:hypothetical protein
MLRRIGAGALLTICAGLAYAAPANAFWAETFDGFHVNAVHFYAEPGETNTVTAVGVDGVPATAYGTPSVPGAFLIHDSTATVTAPPAGRGGGCAKVDDHTISCGNGFIGQLWLDLGDRDDTLLIGPADTSFRVVARGGDGNDTLKSDTLSGASLMGDAGNDRITIRGDNDGDAHAVFTDGGPGDDVIDIANGYVNNFTCGSGYDLVYSDPGDDPYNHDCEDIRPQALPVGLP